MLTIDSMNALRRELGLTYQELSEKSGVPMGTVQKILGGITKNPRLATMEHLQDTLLQLQDEKAGSLPLFQNSSVQVPLHGIADKGKAYQAYGGEYTRASGRPGMVKEPGAVYGSGTAAESGNGDNYTSGHVWTVEEREKLPDDVMTELIDGRLYYMASPSLPHQDVSLEVYAQIRSCIREHHAPCHVYAAPVDVQLDRDDQTMVVPDVFIICDRRQITKKNIQGAPDFILEVLSPSTRRRDMVIKLGKYYRAGVKEYWLMDPDSRQVIVYQLHSFNEGGSDRDNGGKGKEMGNSEDHGRGAGDENHKADGSFTASIYGFTSRIPLGISKGMCVIDMNPIREMLEDLY